ncbi:erythrocyte membrane protein 1, PfEMP1, putative [Plasmodium gaboni]|uniref:Erythrocyte membrane protein 1, PfEMP1, putative n=2 Tax=Plasmodium gaboni TaxID=647221 RepID=A0ABY1UVA8_9APIC|nr:erythrocyte membrane protein 1, PfEMP1, putative [Plasmodium gaboni]
MPGSRPGHPPPSLPPPPSGSGTGGISGSTQAPSKVPATTTPTKTYSINNECDRILKDMSNYWDCNQNDNGGNPVCKPENGTTSSHNDDFYTLFEKWVDLFLNEYETFKYKIKDCNKNQNVCPDDYCRNKCYCLNKCYLNGLDLYFTTIFKEKIYKTLGSEISIQELQQNAGKNDPLKPILMKSQELIDDCMRKCPKKLECSEKGFKNEWDCNQTTTTASSGSSTETEICLKRDDKDKYKENNMNNVSDVNKFYDSFEEWIDYMEKSINEKMKILKQSCHTTYTLSRNSGSGSLNCEMCKDECECYKNWKEKIDKQWEKLQGYYKKYQNNGSSDPSSGTNPMKDIDLNVFLEALCETKYSDNSGGTSQDDICTKLKGDKQNFVDGLIQNSDENKSKVCNVCEEKKKYDEKVNDATCNKIIDIDKNKCKTKDYDNTSGGKTWNCEDKPHSKNVCMSPRTQQLCVANMYSGGKSGSIIDSAFQDAETIKKYIQAAMKKETENLYEYYNKGGPIISKKPDGTPGKPDPNGMPKNFCKAAYRTYNDFKHMVLGDSISKHDSIKEIGEEIRKVLAKPSGGSGGTTPKDWWDTHSDEFWNALKCGIKDSGNKNNSGNECPRLINDDDQFEWWAKEWSDDFYEKRNQVVKDIETKCSGKKECDNSTNVRKGECGTECGKYKNFLDKKKKEWTENFKKFLDEKETKQNKNSSDDEKAYMPQNHYLLYPCTYQSCDGKHIKDLLGNKDHGELQNKCTCDTSQQTQEQNDPCSDKFEFHACNDKKYDLGLWSSTYVTNPRDRGKVFAPPRRNSICIGWLFSPLDTSSGGKPLTKDPAKNELKQKVIDAAKGEAHYLQKYYKDKQDKSGAARSGTNPPTGYCESLKRSFADIGDMVKGTDLWSGGYSELVEQNIHDVFAMKDGSKTLSEEQILTERKQWWEGIREDVWKAMDCKDNNKCGDNIPEDDQKPQFLRWLEEWSEYMCEERQKQIKQLEEKCNGNGNKINEGTCATATPTCKSQCKAYNSWITTHKNEWLGQKSKYNEIIADRFHEHYDDFNKHMKGNTNANTYIEQQCKSCDKCKSGSTNVNMDTIFNKTDDDYKKYEPFCTTCRIKDIAQKAKENSRINPCGDKSRPTTSVKNVANEMKTQAQKEAESRLDGDINKLKGNIENAKFKNGKTGNDLKEEICKLDKDIHTNDGRGDGEPCKGKGTGKGKDNQRFAVGLQWKTNDKVDPNHNGVLFPPRRLDMCTSNLEHLKTDEPGLTDGNKAIHSLLGDVMLAAKEEANKIIELYKNKNGVPSDNQSICRSMKASFADLADIVRGRDLWTKNRDMEKLEGKLKKIFEKIKQNLTDPSKYNDSDDKHIKLREHWWSANRDQIWKAMSKCGTTNPCGDDTTPVDDYIPQRLRWLTEWAEWYCKAQKKEYDKVVEGCKDCKDTFKGDKTCTKCKECKEKCTEYNEFISKWKTDWETQSQKYKTLYQQAKSGTGTDENLKYLNTFLEKLRTENSTNDTYKTAAGYVHEELKNMDCVEQKHFCKKNSSTAPGKEDDSYAFREKPHEYVAACSCIKDNTSQKPPLKPDSAKPATTKPDGDSGRGSARSGRNSNSPVINITEPTKDRQGTIAITTTQTNPDPSSEPGGGSGSSSQPGGQAGKDSGNTGGQSSNVDPGSNKSQPAQAPTQEIPCKIVEEILLKPRDSITGGLYNCNHKTEPFNWDCDPVSMNNKNKGACMPPRRQKLCIHNLTKLDPTKNTDELRRAFIKCAALETHFSWNKYKRGNIQAFSQLKKGTIPDNFLRSMKYSFGDYRDIFFGTDITSHSYIAEVSQNVLNILKEEKDKQAVPKIQNDRELLNKWWETYHKDIWDAMVCSLTHGLTDDSTKTKIKTNYPYSDDIETFAKTPQFLRWFTEWGDEFCHERKTQLNLLHGNCSGYECNKEENEDKKTKCEGSCEIYQTFIDKWKKEYETQSKKYIIDKNEEKYKSTSAQDDVEKANNAYQYLNTQFKELCKNGQCKCMEKPSKQSKTSEPNSSANDVIPKSLDYPPEEFKNSCDCKPPEEEEPDSSLNCVDKSAFDLKNVSHEGIKDVEKTLKGKNTKDVYEGKQKDTDDGPICKTKENNEQMNICKDNGNPFDDIDKWECKNRIIKVVNENICLPPRRKHMCTKLLEKLELTTTSDELFKNVLLTAANEGKHLKEQWEKTKNNPKAPDGTTTTRPSIKRYELCDAIKYSFADLGDIIRGRDIHKGTNGSNEIETKLNDAFQSIYAKWKSANINHKDKYKDVTSFRSAWWDANRVSIWKAMTCSAPNNFYFVKRGKGGGSDIEVLTSSEHTNCGHKYLPPNDDYIPQVFRWISEWSENYCLSQNHKMSIFKDCENCKKNKGKCEQKVRDACKKCKEKCDKYKEFVDKWKEQYGVLEKAYEKIYTKATASSGTNTNVDENTKTFVQKLKDICNNPKTSGEYLDKGNYCKKLKFSITSKGNNDYAFNEPANFYKENCVCANKFEEVDQCPVDNEECKKYFTYLCRKKSFNKELDEWTKDFVKQNSKKTRAVMVPPRRRNICFTNIYRWKGRRRLIKSEKEFTKYLLDAAATEAKYLSQLYNGASEKTLQAMKYSFSDYGDIVKGTDMLNDGISDKIKEIFERIQKNKNIQNKNHRQYYNVNDAEIKQKRQSWWEENKHKVWNVMMCHYTGKDKTDTKCPSHNNIDKENQFLRWFTEWGENLCTRRNELYNNMLKKCNNAICDKSKGIVDKTECTEACQRYRNYVLQKKLEYEIQKNKYDEGFKRSQGNRKAHNFLKNNCYEHTCECLSNNFSDDTKWNDPYDTFDDTSFKNICDCKKLEEISIKTQKKKERKKNTKKKRPEDEHSPAVQPDSKSIPVPKTLEPPQNNEPFNSDILSSTLPLGIGFSLASVALLFYMKKKPKLGPTKLFRVIDIPQNDYSMPKQKSSNKYVPYRSHGYKGKTYIYVEGEETDDYIVNISSSDITSSSESEYEEMDINDIYGYKSPKYKTLIELVLKPSTNNNVQDTDDDTPYTQSVPLSDIPTNKFTDEEWNELKEDFISNMLQSDNIDIPENLPGNITDTQSDIVDNTVREKPFITQIQDRKLYGDNEIIYNIDWNVPENINRTTNNMDIPKYFSNDQYTGIDLINDSLNNDQHVDIYEEILKRKENELYGTTHPKNTTFNRVATETYTDPIMNQLNLFHEWLDRHRDMCEKWNNKEEMLSKLNEQWNKENNEHVLYIPLNDNADDINTINDENYNMINANKHERNDKTSLEHLG